MKPRKSKAKATKRFFSYSRSFLLQVPLIVHLLVEDTIHADGTILVLFIENNMMPNLETKEPGLYDIIFLFKENRQIVQPLYSGVNLPIINDSLIFRPSFYGVVPNAVQIGNGLSG
jgi:hypothetical protein